jgi:hypothetical protein
MDQGKHYGGGADSHSESEQRDGGEARLAAEGAEGIAEILRKIFEPAGSSGIAAAFFDLLGATESHTGLAARFFGRIALRDQVGDVLIEMETEFPIEALFVLFSAQQASEPAHAAPPSVRRRTRATASAKRSQLAVSAPS